MSRDGGPRVAFIMAGQGAEVPGMGLGLGDGVMPWLDRVRVATGFDVVRALTRSDPALRASEILQPTLVAIQLATVEALAVSGVRPCVVAGHSLGELAAISIAGGLDGERAVRLAAVRGKLMSEAARVTPGGMIACEREVAGLELAAHNAADEWVMTGESAAIKEALATARGTRLPVAGPWHSRHMAAAQAAFAGVLEDVPFARSEVDVVLNGDGRIARQGDATTWREALAGQLTRPIRWVSVLAALADADVFVTIGPGKVMRGLIRKVLGERPVLSTEDARDVAKTIEALR